MLPTLREAIERATTSVVEEISADAVKRVKATSVKLAKELGDSYGDFFDRLHEDVLNDDSISFALAPALPSFFVGRKWPRVSDQWFKQKEKAKKAGDAKALYFYHGVTKALSSKKKGPTRNRKGQFAKPRSKVSFDQFIASLAKGGKAVTNNFFGPLSVEYSITRPDKGTVRLLQLDNAVTQIRQWKGKGYGAGGGFPIDGTTIRTTFIAFPKADKFLTEKSLVEYLVRVGGAPEQWVKVFGGGRRASRIRGIILPLINWYARVEFKLILKDAFK